ncbi:hypothetical protein SEPCBS119000_001699 [Sporothrix epigloea]|uniref:MFS transporter n=1 Tax=Sporothrix epigloea TaxID=1892477 RepID=A0ABP0DDQ9_9PEZI
MDKPVDMCYENADAEASVPELAPGHQNYIDPVIEKRVVRKTDRVVLVILFFCYLLGFLDRSNIGNAQTAGMGEDLGMSDAQYQWLLTIFYIPYILFECCVIFFKILPPHIFASITVMLWGIAATLQATAFNWQGMMACRFFLAMAEASFSPGLPYVISFFYGRSEVGFRCGVFLSAAPLATTFAGALAYGITSAKTSIASWRLLFIVEGIPSIIMAVIVYYCLPDSPDTAKFLTEEEREVARARSVLQSGQEGKDRLGTGGVNFSNLLLAFKQPHTLIMPLMYFSCNVSFSSLPVFLPAILTSMGFTSIHAQGLTAPPYFLAFLVCIGTTYLSDRIKQRGLIVFCLSVMGGTGYVLLATCKSVAPRYLGVFLAASGVFPSIANALPWVLNNQGDDTRRGIGIAMLNVIGQCGPLLGTRAFPKADRPYYRKGMSICAGFMFFNAILALVLRQYFVYRNRLLERAEAAARAEHPEAHPEKISGAPERMVEVEGSLGYRFVL